MDYNFVIDILNYLYMSHKIPNSRVGHETYLEVIFLVQGGHSPCNYQSCALACSLTNRTLCISIDIGNVILITHYMLQFIIFLHTHKAVNLLS